MRRGVVALVVGAFALALAAPSAATTFTSGIGCHPAWPVVAYQPGGQLARVPPPSPVPCAVATGYPASESSLAITPHGTLVYSPAETENTVARSTDGGLTWSLAYPADEQYTSFWNTVDPYVIADPRTGRVFWAHATGPVRTEGSLPQGAGFYLAAASGFQLYASSDEGRTFSTADYSTAPTGDWEKEFVGPPRPAETGSPQPPGYPDIVYLCANSPAEVVGPGRICYRSLDGGATFSVAGYVSPSPGEPHDTCPPLSANNAVVDSQGVIYLPFTCLGAAYVVISYDEGTSWVWTKMSGATPGSLLPDNAGRLQLAVDSADNLYALWSRNDQLYMAMSRDHARSWSAPAVVSGPGLHQLEFPFLTAAGPGQVGIAYYGSTSASANQLSAYVSVTRDALSPGSIFYNAPINDPAQPIFHDYSLGVSPRVDFIGGAFDPQGNFWVGAVRQFGAPDQNNHIATTGWVGHLEFASVTRAHPRPTRHHRRKRRRVPHRKRRGAARFTG
jgi:hypothetical protein